MDDALSKGNPGNGRSGVTTVAEFGNAVLSNGIYGVAVQNQGGGITTLSPGGPVVTVGIQGESDNLLFHLGHSGVELLIYVSGVVLRALFLSSRNFH